MAFTEDERRAPLRALLAEAGSAQARAPEQAQGPGEGGAGASGGEPMEALTGTQLRDRLIAANPLDRDWIARVNQVSAALRMCLRFRCAAFCGRSPGLEAGLAKSFRNLPPKVVTSDYVTGFPCEMSVTARR